MSNYLTIPRGFWEKVSRLSDDERVMIFYLVACPHRTSEGLYRLRAAYIAADLEWGSERVSDALSRLIETGLIRYCSTCEVVWIVDLLVAQVPKGEKQIKGACNKLRELPATCILPLFINECERLSEDLGKALRKEFEGVPDTPCNTPSISRTPTHTPTPPPTPTPLVSAGAADDVDEATSDPASLHPATDELCQRLADKLLEHEVVDAPLKWQPWRKEMDLLLRRGPTSWAQPAEVPPANVAAIIDFTAAHSWLGTRGNVRSAKKLREHWDRLRRERNEHLTGDKSPNRGRDQLAESVRQLQNEGYGDAAPAEASAEVLDDQSALPSGEETP